MSPFCLHQRARPGFFLLDVLLGVTIFSIFVGFAGSSLLFSQQTVIKSGDRIRGSSLSQKAIEATRSISYEDFDSVQAGTFGIQIGADGKWEFAGIETVSSDGFTTWVDITLPGDDRIEVVATTSWSFGQQRFGMSSIATTLANWHQVKETGNWSMISEEGSFVDETVPLFNDIATDGNYAFVTSEDSTGGAGLYVFDMSNLSFPTRIADGFALGAAGYQLVVSGNVLYILTSMPGSELMAYDITSPDTFSAANLLGTFNLPGSARGQSLAIFGDTLFVGAVFDGVEDELYALDVYDLSDIQLLDSIGGDGNFLGLSLHDGYAYIASSEDVSELTVMDVFDPNDLQVAPGAGYNLTDVLDGTAVTTFGSFVLLGRDVGDVTQELVLFEIEESPIPTPPPGPWYHTMGAKVNALDRDPTGSYAFVASEYEGGEFQVMDMTLFQAGQLPRVAIGDTETGNGRGVYYDPQIDRVFFTTNTALIIYKPS
ncbi:hypothetical protein KKF55_04030 [Patescibacteria group bacterium]|nr:hypothetical protein [Patescibacteria group bacterium]